MMGPMTWIEARVWQIAAAAGLGGAAMLAVALGVQAVKTQEARRGLEAGARREAALVRSLAATEAALAQQAAGVRALKAAADARVALADRAVRAGRAPSMAAEAASARILALTPPGTDLCARMAAVDAAFLEALQ